MDVFRLNNTGSTWANSDIIDGITSKVWSERYRSAGEFTFKAIPTKTMLQRLPLGALISHTNTLDIMMVENHEIVEEQNSTPVLTITGRSLPSFLEQRVATDHDLGFSPSPLYDGSPWPYLFDNETEKGQLLSLMRSQIDEIYVTQAQMALPHTSVIQELKYTNQPPSEREVERGELYLAVLDLLKELDAGLKVERPNKNRPQPNHIYWILHDGFNKRSTVQFSYDANDLASARYFRSNKTDKNAAYILAPFAGQYWQEATAYGGYAKRVMFIKADDIKMNPTPGPQNENPPSRARVNALLDARGRRVVKRKKKTDILEATVSNNSRFVFKKDYDIGDIVWVVGNYDTSDEMRVVEYTETEDENGTTGYPTLVKLT